MQNVQPTAADSQAAAAKPAKPVFTLTLVAEPRYGDDSGMRRLRAVLKLLLRGFGFRCTWIEYPPEPVPADDDYAHPMRPAPQQQEGPR